MGLRESILKANTVDQAAKIMGGVVWANYPKHYMNRCVAAYKRVTDKEASKASPTVDEGNKGKVTKQAGHGNFSPGVNKRSNPAARRGNKG